MGVEGAEVNGEGMEEVEAEEVEAIQVPSMFPTEAPIPLRFDS